LKQELEKRYEEFVNRQDWKNAKTYQKFAPHEYIVYEHLSSKNKKLFSEFARFIKVYGYDEYFYKTKYTYYNINGFKYWVIENVMNRARRERKYVAQIIQPTDRGVRPQRSIC
jgi:mRNA-degrading endonuclease HigB of HigAB toxin-antitoxin module